MKRASEREGWLYSLRHVTGSDAARAHLDAPNGSVAYGLDLLQVRIPGSAGLVVGVADVVAEAGAFAAYFTNLGHVVVPST